MPYIPLNEQRKRLVCPICGEEKLVHPLAQTCSQRCSQRAARLRRAARDGHFGALAPTEPVDPRVLEVLTNPTLEQLATKSQALAAFADAERVFVLKGTVPVVENTPVGIGTVIRDTKGEWLLLKI